jgi:hypothetical protein
VLRIELQAAMLSAAGHVALLENAVLGAGDLLPGSLAQEPKTLPLTFAREAMAGSPMKEQRARCSPPDGARVFASCAEFGTGDWSVAP